MIWFSCSIKFTPATLIREKTGRFKCQCKSMQISKYVCTSMQVSKYMGTGKWPCPLPWKRLWSVQFINFDFCYAWIKCKPDIHDTLWLYKLIIHYQGNREVETLSVFTCFAIGGKKKIATLSIFEASQTISGRLLGELVLVLGEASHVCAIWRLVDLILPKQNGWKHVICAVKPLLHLLPWHWFSSNISLTTDCIPRTHRIT